MTEGMDSAKVRLTTDNSMPTETSEVFKTQRLTDPLGLTSELRTDSKSNIDAPKDRAKAVYLTFLLYGIGVLLPFNVLMSCLDYYAEVVSTIHLF